MALAALLVAVMAAACAACASPVAEEVAKWPVGKLTSEVVELQSGDRFQVVLDANPRTEYSWTVEMAPDPSVARQVGEVQVLNPRRAGLDTGAPGRRAWTFEAVAPGETEVVFESRIPGRKDAEAAWTHDVIVDVYENLEPIGEVQVFKSTGGPIELPVGAEFDVDLSDDAGWNGYRWLFTTDYNNRVVVFKGVRLRRDEGTVVSFEETWRFHVVSRGEATLTFFQIEPWKEPAEPREVRNFRVKGF